MQHETHRATARLIASIVTVMLAAAGCVTEGTAIGEAEFAGRDRGRATLVWESDLFDQANGDIAGRMPDGTEYAGRYRQTVARPASGAVTVDWDGNPSQYDSRRDATVYTREVIAHLRSADGGKELRCSFTLAEPERGPAGGGTGFCATSDGESIDRVVLREAE